MSFKKLVPSTLKKSLTNALGWKTNRKIVVFESDDWGSQRMPSKQAWKYLKNQGLQIDDYYNRLDSLETGNDLGALCEVLNSFRDSHDRPAIVTANYLMANPDFDRIRADQYNKYHYELVFDTYRKTLGCDNAWQALQQGIVAAVLRPQLHGREHLNVPLWMAALRAGHKDTLLAFEQECWGHITNFPAAKRSFYLAACDYNSEDEALLIRGNLVEGVRLFAQIFGYQPETFIAPNYIWDSGIELALKDEGINTLQGQRNQLIPSINSSRCRPLYHFTGQTNRLWQRYLVRNAHFEPASDPSRDWVNTCLKEISSAFLWRTPAIVSTHRVNFIGSLDPENRDRNLKLLYQLLTEISRQWPEVDFMASDQLGRLVRARYSDEK